MVPIPDAPGSYAATFDVEPSIDLSLRTDQLFGAAVFEKGPTTPTLIYSERKLLTVYGSNRVAGSQGLDSARTFLRAGKILRLQRIIGLTPVLATKNFSNAVPAVVFRVDALYYGTYANALTAEIEAGVINAAARVLVIADATTELERSPEFTTLAEFVAWGAASNYVRVVQGVGVGLPVVTAPGNLTGGTDDHASITDTQRQAALDAFLDPRYGPGNVSLFGATTTAAYAMLLAHHDANPQHHVLLDMQDVSNEATPIGAVQTLHDDTGAKGSSAYWPWATTVDGFPIPPSAAVAAAMARQDLAIGHPNEAAAGEGGRLKNFSLPAIIGGLSRDVTEAQRGLFNNAGINVLWDTDGQGDIQIYGFRTLVDETIDPLNLLVPNVRLDMYIRAAAIKIGKRYFGKQIDGQKHRATLFGAELTGLLRDLYARDALFGETEDDAFQVHTLELNTPETAAERQLLARLYVKRSPGAEWTLIEIFNFDVTAEFPS